MKHLLCKIDASTSINKTSNPKAHLIKIMCTFVSATDIFSIFSQLMKHFETSSNDINSFT